MERTTTSRHFTWIEEYQGGVWNGMRNSTTVFEIKVAPARHEDGKHYEVHSRLPGQSNFALGSYSLETAQQMADEYFERWLSMMGLATKS